MQEGKRATEAETVGWHKQLNGREFEQTPWEIVKERGAWHAVISGITKSQT